MHSRPGLGEAHGQQHVQSGPMFDGTWPVLPLPPRSHFGIQFLLRCHASKLHPSLAASLIDVHVLEISKERKEEKATKKVERKRRTIYPR